MEFFDDFMYKIIQRKEGKKTNNPFSKYQGIVLSEEMQKKMQGDETDEGPNVIDGIDLQSLLSRVNFEKRWVYRGSFTTPPALEGVMWNIIDDVQYMKSKTLRLFKNSNFQHPRGDSRCDTCAGNNRVLMPINDRTVYYVQQKQGQK